MPKRGTDTVDRPGCCSNTRRTQRTHRHANRTWLKQTREACASAMAEINNANPPPTRSNPNTAMRTPYCDYRWRPYRVECTGSLPTSEVKRRRARLVLGWGAAREDLRVLPALQTPHDTTPHRALKPNGRGNGALITAGGHTASNAPDLFRLPKLSGAGPG